MKSQQPNPTFLLLRQNSSHANIETPNNANMKAATHLKSVFLEIAWECKSKGWIFIQKKNVSANSKGV
jgi:hypothetical protein